MEGHKVTSQGTETWGHAHQSQDPKLAPWAGVGGWMITQRHQNLVPATWEPYLSGKMDFADVIQKVGGDGRVSWIPQVGPKCSRRCVCKSST